MARIALFSLISRQSATAGALWSEAFLRALPESKWSGSQIDVFADDRELKQIAAERLENELGFQAIHYLQAASKHRRSPYNHILFQLEDQPRAAFIRRMMTALPGIKCFHDLSLAELHVSEFEHTTAGGDLNKSVRERFGPNTLPLGDMSVRGWSISSALKLYSFIEAELASAGSNCVFRKEALDWLGRHYSSATPTLLATPLGGWTGIQQISGPRDGELARKSFVVGFSVEETAKETIRMYLEACAPLCKEGKLTIKLLTQTDIGARQAGYLCSTNSQLAVTICRSRNYQEHRANIADCDIIIALEPDIRRALSPTGMLGLASTCIVFLSSHFVPGLIEANCAVPIRAGVGEFLELQMALAHFIENPDELWRMKVALKQILQKNHSHSEWMAQTIAQLERASSDLCDAQAIWHSRIETERRSLLETRPSAQLPGGANTKLDNMLSAEVLEIESRANEQLFQISGRPET